MRNTKYKLFVKSELKVVNIWKDQDGETKSLHSPELSEAIMGILQRVKTTEQTLCKDLNIEKQNFFGKV